MLLPHPCTARRSNGEPCSKSAIRGGTVCNTHGGSAPQVKQKALERLAALVDPTLAYWTQVISDTRVDDDVRVRVGRDILDRAGFKPEDVLKLKGSADEPLEIIISRTRTNVPPVADALNVPLD